MVPIESLRARQLQLKKVLLTSRLDALVLNPGPTLTYLTGLHFHLSERPVLALFVTGKVPIIVLPELESAKVANLPYKARIFTYGENPAEWTKVFRDVAKMAQLEGTRVGMETRRMRVLELRLLEKAAPRTFFLDAQKEIASLRMFKDPGEIEAMKKGAEVAEAAMQATLPQIRVGQTEKEIANTLTIELLRHGSHPELPFSPIVASGPNSANPHATPTDRQLQNGDLLIIDWGANIDDYYSDITRTFRVGDIDPELRTIANAVLAANRAAAKQAKPGAEAGSVDLAAREVIYQAGYAQYFIHRTGHGLGMEGHEEPYIRSDNALPLQPGMVFTIEPGIYLPNRGGVRIEDDVVITKDGLISLTTLPRELLPVG